MTGKLRCWINLLLMAWGVLLFFDQFSANLAASRLLEAKQVWGDASPLHIRFFLIPFYFAGTMVAISLIVLHRPITEKLLYHATGTVPTTNRIWLESDLIAVLLLLIAARLFFEPIMVIPQLLDIFHLALRMSLPYGYGLYGSFTHFDYSLLASVCRQIGTDQGLSLLQGVFLFVAARPCSRFLSSLVLPRSRSQMIDGTD